MSHVDHGFSEEELIHHGRSSINETTSPSLISNFLMGIVISKTEGLTRTTLRIRVGEHTDVRVRWQATMPTRGAADIGQTVYVIIPEKAVHLEAGGFRRGKQRWNRWIGRVVLVNRKDEDPITTVKLHRESITLKSVGPVMGARAALSVWDTVNIVVDPQQVRLVPVRRPCSQVMPSISSSSLTDSYPSSVWLHATIRSVRSIPAGQLVALDVGGANLSAVIEPCRTAMPPWIVGASVEISINSCDGWIRHYAESPMLPCSFVLSSEFGVRQPMR